MSKTTMLTHNDIRRHWHVVDLNGQTLGRAATQVAKLLIGKHKPAYTPHMDSGDYVVVVNANSVNVTGAKFDQKLYRHHTGYPGGFREFTYKQVAEKDITKIIKHAVQGMLPKNKLRAARLKRLKIFVDDSHPYQQQIEQSK